MKYKKSYVNVMLMLNTFAEIQQVRFRYVIKVI